MTNTVVPFITLVVLVVFLIPLLVFKLASYTKRFTSIENAAGKVVLITGASSGIGEHLAYEYARKGACLVLVARREDRLKLVAEKAIQLGSPDVIVIPADVSKVDDCKQFVEKAVQHFGILDCLVNNAGISRRSMFEELESLSDFTPVMETNFWGSVYPTHFAIPHLKKTKGKIVVIASAAGWLCVPRSSFYNASKAALIAFYETLRVEFGSDIGITIVTPAWVDTDMVPEHVRSKVKSGFSLVESTEGCAEAIVSSALRGDKYMIKPFWIRIVILFKWFLPNAFDFCLSLLMEKPKRLKLQSKKV